MRRLRSVLCLLCLLPVGFLLVKAWNTLPLDNQPLIARKYEGWSGVLRLWAFEGWPCGAGDFAPWINQCIRRFESEHPGVYIQPQFVDADELAGFHDIGVLPPDMLLFPPGLLDSPEDLVRLELPDGLRSPLRHCGMWDGTAYAIPVAMGGYMWALNRALIDRIPIDWQGLDDAMASPRPEAWRHWDAALLALCAGYPATSEENADLNRRDLSALDLGLSLPSATAPAATPPTGAAVTARHLPKAFQFSDETWNLFINGELAAMPVTQREVRRLEKLSDLGRDPDWQLSAGDAAFSDQLLCLSVVAKENSEAQRDLCLDFASFIVQEECQSSLCLVSAFSVTDAPSGYAPGDPLAALDDALRDDALATPNCFAAGWADDANAIVRKFIDNLDESPVLWRELRSVLGKNPNIS